MEIPVLENCSRQNYGPWRCPSPWILWLYFVTWQKELCRGNRTGRLSGVGPVWSHDPLKAENFLQLEEDAAEGKVREFQVWEGLDVLLGVLRSKGSHMRTGEKPSELRQPLDDNLQGSRDLSFTTLSNWIQPTTWMSLELHPSPEPPVRSATLPPPWFGLSETHVRLMPYRN